MVKQKELTIRVGFESIQAKGPQYDLLFLFTADSGAIEKRVTEQCDILTAGGFSASGVLRDCKGNPGEFLTAYCHGGRVKRVALLGVGDPRKLTRSTIRDTGVQLSKWMRRIGAKSAVTIVQGDLDEGLALDERAAAIAEGIEAGNFEFDEFKSSPSDSSPLRRLNLTIAGASKSQTSRLKSAIQSGKTVAEGRNLARYVGHLPGNALSPPDFARIARIIAKRDGLVCTVMNEARLEKERCHAILTVGRAAKHPPRMIVLEHRGRSRAKRRPVVLVGKGITFDSGGLQVKPSEAMIGMKYDKCGAAAVLGAMSAIARLKLETPVIGIIAAAENAISAEAYRPDDIINTRNGKTVEIVSTDAEGRLVLADALDYAKKFKPAAIIDLATLTGGIVVALGDAAAGLMSNDDELSTALAESGERCGELCWRLPLYDRYAEQMKSVDADLKNAAGGRKAHALTAGAFLREFVEEKTPWAHLDIAGVARSQGGQGEGGASGYGVTLLIEYLRSLQST
jgi:leucyl aminopeptidase